MHNANLTVDSSTLQSMAKDLVTLLEDAKELGKRAETLEAVRKITEVGLTSLSEISACLSLCHPQYLQILGKIKLNSFVYDFCNNT